MYCNDVQYITGSTFVATWPTSSLPESPAAGFADVQNYCTGRSNYMLGELNPPKAELKSIFYTDALNNELLYRTKLGTSLWGPPISILSTTDTANGVAVDYYNKKVYFTRFNPDPGEIVSCSFDGTDSGVVLDTGDSGNDERGIAVCPRLGKIFWCLRDSKNEIHSASLDGSNTGRILNNTEVDDPYDIVVDQANEKLYYVCASARTPAADIAFSASIDGSNHGPLATELQDLLRTDEQDFMTIGVDIDRINQKLYFLGQHGPEGAPDVRIHISDYDGANASLIVSDQRSDSYQPIDIQVDPWGDRIYYCYIEDDSDPDLMISCSLSNPGTGSENLSGLAFPCGTSSAAGTFVKMSMNFQGVEECPHPGTPTRFSGSTLYTAPVKAGGEIVRAISPLKSIGTNSDPDRT